MGNAAGDVGAAGDQVTPAGTLDSTATDVTNSAVGDARAAGAVGKGSDAGHRHGREAFATPVGLGSANAAGVATTVPRSDHVHAGQATRTFYVHAVVGTSVDSATNVTLGSAPNSTKVMNLADAATQGILWTFQMPVDAGTATVLVRPFWAPVATDAVAHTVRWSYNIKIISAGNDVTAAGTTLTWTGDSAARTANISVLETGQASTAVTPTAGDFVRLELQRIGADGADTYVGAVGVVGVQITYTSVM